MFNRNLNDIDLNILSSGNPAPLSQNSAKVSSKNDLNIINEMMSLDQHFILIMKNRLQISIKDFNHLIFDKKANKVFL